MVQAYWAERLGWEMGLVHAFMLDMFERLYAVSELSPLHDTARG